MFQYHSNSIRRNHASSVGIHNNVLQYWFPLSRVRFSGVRQEDNGGGDTIPVPSHESTSFGRGTV
jgi:hypothetical protein